MAILDLVTLGHGGTYADVYGSWLEIFKRIAESEEVVTVVSPPKCWVPLLLYCGADVIRAREVFHCDAWILDPIVGWQQARAIGREREYVEHVCALRPELVDALWKVDSQWKTKRVFHTQQRSFVIASYSSLYRPELREFMKQLDEYRKDERIDCAVITNCSADKPYPAPLHVAIADVLPKNGKWHRVIATGVLGAVPEEMWSGMPLYDSGLPDFWRNMTRWEEYLGRNRYRALVVYTEFYSRSLHRALSLVLGSGTFVDWVTPVGPYADYLNLLSPTNLAALREAIDRHK